MPPLYPSRDRFLWRQRRRQTIREKGSKLLNTTTDLAADHPTVINSRPEDSGGKKGDFKSVTKGKIFFEKYFVISCIKIFFRNDRIIFMNQLKETKKENTNDKPSFTEGLGKVR